MKTLAALLLCLLSGGPLSAAIATQVLNYQGQLTDAADNVYNGTQQMIFEVFGSESGGVALWSTGLSNVPVTRGLFNVELPVSGLAPAQLNGELWLQVTVNSQTLSPASACWPPCSPSTPTACRATSPATPPARCR